MDKVNRKYFFLTGLPRTGNTFLSALLNQNKNLYVNANSVAIEILRDAYKVKNKTIYTNFPDQISFDNVLKNIYNNYFFDCPDIVIDRVDYGDELNTYIIENYIQSKNKIIVLVRPLLDILNSLANLYIEKNYTEMSLTGHLLNWLNKDGMILRYIQSIHNLKINKNVELLFIEYDKLIKQPKIQINKIYHFLQLDYYNHDIKNIDELCRHNVKYDDSVYGLDLHKIQNKIQKRKLTNYLPTLIKEKFKLLNYYWK